MPRVSKARKQRLDSLARARANNSCNNSNNNSNISLNDALIGTQLETTDHSESDTNLEDQIDDDATPEIYEDYDSDVTQIDYRLDLN